MTGFVYFARRGRGIVKIGASWRPDLRVRALCTKTPGLRLLGFVEGPRQAERFVHNTLASARIVGEWYWPRAQVLDFIEEAIRRGQIPGFARWWREGAA